MIKVEISGAHAVIHEVLRAMLEHAGYFDVVGEAFDGAVTLSLSECCEVRQRHIRQRRTTRTELRCCHDASFFS